MELYKYVTAERMDVLIEQRIRFTPPPFFNDPFESSPVLSFDIEPDEWRRIGETERERQGLPQEVVEWSSDPDHMSRYIPVTLEVLISLLRNTVGVLSLTERPDNLIMWAHYADQHRGFVIGFDSTHPWFAVTDKFRVNVLGKVAYANTRPSSGLKTLTLDDLYLTKSIDWSYESEWRMFRFLGLADQRIESGSEPVHLFGFPPELITKVIIGCRTTLETRQKLQSALLEDKYRHVSMQIAVLDSEHYKLNLTNVDITRLT